VGYKVRYVVWVTIPLVLLLGAGAARGRTPRSPLQSRLVGPAVVLLVFLFAVAIYNRHYVDRYRNEDAAGVASYLRMREEGTGPICAKPPSGRSGKLELSPFPAPAIMPVFVISFYMADPVGYYLGDGWDVQFLPDVEADGDDPSEAMAPIDRGVRAGAGYWLVYSRPFHGDPKGTLLARLTQRDHLRLEATFTGIELYRGERGKGE
jgi:hypothetical protein